MRRLGARGVRASLGCTRRSLMPLETVGLRDRAVGFGDTGRTVMIPQGMVAIRNIYLLQLTTAQPAS
jgi:hypothetical protein